ncbi:MAG: hypothetical protein IKI58_09810 [Oscillospiraceae bacterium]|nr:hypothetical protein [Oscillospiraceae bacterium]
MGMLRSAVLCGCFASVAFSLAEGILPLERFQKQIRLLITVLLLSVLLRPVLHLKDAELSIQDADVNPQTETLTASLKQAQESAVSESICNALNRALSEKNIACTVSECSLHIDPDNSIIINEVVITGNVQTGTVYLREWLGTEVKIREGGSSG